MFLFSRGGSSEAGGSSEGLKSDTEDKSSDDVIECEPSFGSIIVDVESKSIECEDVTLNQPNDEQPSVSKDIQASMFGSIITYGNYFSREGTQELSTESLADDIAENDDKDDVFVESSGPPPVESANQQIKEQPPAASQNSEAAMFGKIMTYSGLSSVSKEKSIESLIGVDSEIESNGDMIENIQNVSSTESGDLENLQSPASQNSEVSMFGKIMKYTGLSRDSKTSSSQSLRLDVTGADSKCDISEDSIVPDKLSVLPQSVPSPVSQDFEGLKVSSLATQSNNCLSRVSSSESLILDAEEELKLSCNSSLSLDDSHVSPLTPSSSSNVTPSSSWIGRTKCELCGKSYYSYCVVCGVPYCADHHHISVPLSGEFKFPTDLYKNSPGILDYSKTVFVCSSGTSKCKKKCLDLILEKFKNSMAAIVRPQALHVYLSCDRNLLVPFDRPGKLTDSGQLSPTKMALLAVGGAGAIAGTMFWYGSGIGEYYSVVRRVYTLAKSGMDTYSMYHQVSGVSEEMYALVMSLVPAMSDALPRETEKMSSFQKTKLFLTSYIYFQKREEYRYFWEQSSSNRVSRDISQERGPIHQVDSSLFEYIGSFLGPVQWLYFEHFPGGMDSDEWRYWYLQKFIRHAGNWKFIGGSLRSREVPLYGPIPVFIPAFAIAIRDEDEYGRPGLEAVISIRGTAETKDISTDLNFIEVPFYYRSGESGDVEVEGVCHGGLFKAAMHILDYCHIWSMIEELHSKDYKISFCGHSLGAGVACLMAAIVKNRFYEKYNECPFMPAVGFGVPAVVHPFISKALQEDGLVISVVNQNDLVPRLSLANIKPVTEDLYKYYPKARELFSADFSDYIDHVYALGEKPGVNCREYQEELSKLKSAEIDFQNDNCREDDTDLPMMEVDTTDTGDDENMIDEPPKLMKVETKLEDRVLVPPGRILLFTEDVVAGGGGADSDIGGLKVMEVTYKYSSLRSLPVMQSALNDHYMSSYVNSYRHIKYKMYSKDIEVFSPLRGTFINATVDDATGGVAMREQVLNGEAGRRMYASCYLCEQDVTWCYITSSISCRAAATHRCGFCNQIVCSVCAPIGDEIPGSRGDTITLPDKRLVNMGYHHSSPQRICYACFYRSQKL
mmetsp:Transcript_11824/g.19250  ORF Transcript_11824/g.19250 Transcript_11824/m.19250 type:complete len:1123 (-) Transcript_11824:165-3533(-)